MTRKQEMKRQHDSVLWRPRGRVIGGALVGALFAAMPLAAAQANPGGWDQQPNIYTRDFYQNSAAASPFCDAYGQCQSAPIQQPQRRVNNDTKEGGMSAQTGQM